MTRLRYDEPGDSQYGDVVVLALRGVGDFGRSFRGERSHTFEAR